MQVIYHPYSPQTISQTERRWFMKNGQCEYTLLVEYWDIGVEMIVKVGLGKVHWKDTFSRKVGRQQAEKNSESWSCKVDKIMIEEQGTYYQLKSIEDTEIKVITLYQPNGSGLQVIEVSPPIQPNYFF